MSAYIRGQGRMRLVVRLMFVSALCGACESGAPTRPSPAPSPSAPLPTGPVVPHQVEVVYDPDMYNRPVLPDSDGSYPLDSAAAGWYCVWLGNIPSTPAGHCREYTFTFTWAPDLLQLTDSASDGTSSRRCQTFPTRITPGVCFVTPSRNRVGALQSIKIVGKERMANGEETDVVSTELAIRFRDR